MEHQERLREGYPPSLLCFWRENAVVTPFIASGFNVIEVYYWVNNMSASTLRNKIGVLLLDNPLSLKEIADELEVTEKKAYSLLKNMFQSERVNGFKDADGVRRYRNTADEVEAATKRKEKADKKAAKDAAKKAKA